jgi:hypothetical protein
VTQKRNSHAFAHRCLHHFDLRFRRLRRKLLRSIFLDELDQSQQRLTDAGRKRVGVGVARLQRLRSKRDDKRLVPVLVFVAQKHRRQHSADSSVCQGLVCTLLGLD